MKRPSFLQGIIVAAVLGFFASAVIATLTPFVGLGGVIRLVIPALGLAYIVYLLGRSADRVGRITTVTLWTAFAIASWWMAPPLPLYMLFHAGAIWLVRSLYFYSGVVPALMDLGLTALSVSASVWAIGRSGSVFLAIWCFFLVQSLFIAIPGALRSVRARSARAVDDGENFERSRRRADAALRQIYTQ